MIWWVLTYLDNYRPPHALGVLAETNLAAHLFMKWAKVKPARRPTYKRVRGVNIWCGYHYIWDTPNLVEQSQPGITFEHLFGLIPLAPTDHVWYYLFSIGERPFKECQGPLIHVPPPELPMPSARIFNSIDQPAPPAALVYISFDSVLWDDYHFYDPAQPSRLTIPAGALYEVGMCAAFSIAGPDKGWMEITLNHGAAIVHHSHMIDATGWAGGAFSMQTIMPFHPGDYLECRTYHMLGAGAQINARPNYSPHFWIAQIGAYPISAP